MKLTAIAKLSRTALRSDVFYTDKYYLSTLNLGVSFVF